MGIHFDHKQEYRRAWAFYAIASVGIIFTAVVIYGVDFELSRLSNDVANVFAAASTIMMPITFAIWLSNVHKRLVVLNLLLRSTLLFNFLVLQY